MKKINPDPVSLSERKVGNYGNMPSGGHDQVAICEQMAHMTKAVNKNKTAVDKMVKMCQEVIGAQQNQSQRFEGLMRTVEKLVERVDRAVERGDEGVETMISSAESIRENTLFIMKSTMILAYVMGSDEQVAEAEAKAKRKIAEWQNESKKALTIVSNNA